MANYFTTENPKLVQNGTGNYGIIASQINPAQIEDELTDRGAGLGKLGSSMPSPLARLYLFSAALREINSYEGKSQKTGHINNHNETTGNDEVTPYHDLVGELLDMLEFVFENGDEPDFHVLRWDVNTDCTALETSGNKKHKQLASALRSAFDSDVFKNQPIYLFKWKDIIIGGTSPISLVYTSANLRTDLQGIKFSGKNGNALFADEAIPLHERSNDFKEYLYRLLYTDFKELDDTHPLQGLVKYIRDSAANYDPSLNAEIINDPAAFRNVKDLTSQGRNVMVAGVQLRVSDHTVIINPATTDYLIQPSTDVYKRGNVNTKLPLVLTEQGVSGLTYVNGRDWNEASDKILQVRDEDEDINARDLPGFVGVKYPYLTVGDFFEDKVIEVSYKINKAKFFTGCGDEITYLLPLKKLFFEYFKGSDIFDENGEYTNMLTMKHDNQREKLYIDLNVPLVNGHQICLHKTYDLADGSGQKVTCYDASNTFDFSIFPFYRLEPDTDKNVYNVMLGASINGVSMKFYEPTPNAGLFELKADTKSRTQREGLSPATYHTRVDGAFSFCELTIDGIGSARALIIPLFKRIDSDATRAQNHFTFAIDFGTTNTHVAYAMTQPGRVVGQPDIRPFDYNDIDTQMVMFNDKSGVAEFGAFTTAVKRELVPTKIGANASVKFPMRTATYQVAGSPISLEMFFNTNIGFNYGEDISQTGNYKTNIKWDRFDFRSKDRMKAFFVQMLWMMKNKSVLNDGSDNFDLMVTYPISMRSSDQRKFKNAWNDAIAMVHCNVNINYRTESVVPYYSYLADLNYAEPYANMDIGGGTTDMLYVNPNNHDNHVFSAFFAADDLWNDGIDKANQALKANGFVASYQNDLLPMLGAKKGTVENVIKNAMSSADIVSYLFANDKWTKFSDHISSTRLMELPVIHFAALTFYMAYSLKMADVEIPRRISFTGMGSNYIKLISAEEKDIANIITKVFQYAGKTLNYPKLDNAQVSVTFADNPKEVTAIGSLISINYPRPINPNQDTYFGYEGERLGEIMHYSDITPGVQKSVIALYGKFVDMFSDSALRDVLGGIGYNVGPDVIANLHKYAPHSLNQMYDMSSDGQSPNDPFNEPMFFWPLKDALYQIGKELAANQ